MKRNKTGNKCIALFLALMVGIVFCMSGAEPAYAADKPGAVKKVTAKALSKTSIKVTWRKTKSASGYQLFRNETLIKKGKGASFTDTELKPGLKYTYVVRAYRTYKKTQWFNKKTQKWQSKKPKEKWRGDKRTVTKYKYGSWSPMKTVSTKGKSTVKKPVLKLLLPKSEDKNVAKFVKRYNATDNPYRIKLIKTGTAKGIKPSSYDGLIIPGGKHVHPSFYHAKVKCKKHKFVKSLDRLEIALVKKFVKAKKPVLGICRGCQLINVTLGGTLKQDIGKGHYHDKSRKTLTKKGTDMRKLYGTSVKTLHYHHQAISKLAKGLKVTMVDAKDGTIEAVQHKTLPVYGIQYHPDRMYVKVSPIVRKNGKKAIEYFFDVCYDRGPGRKAAASKKTPTTTAKKPADTQSGKTGQTEQTGQTGQTTGGSDASQTDTSQSDTQTAVRPAIKILLYGADCSSVETFASSYNEGDNSFTIELTTAESAESIAPADYDALVISGNEEGVSLISDFEDAHKPVLVIDPDTLEQDMDRLLQDAAAARSDDSSTLS